jgi:hypothetical protein
MKKLVSIAAALAIVVLAAGVVLAEPGRGKGKGGKQKTHKVFQGHDHMTKDKMAQLDSGTHHLKTHKGHKLFVNLKNGKVAGMHAVTKGGKKVKGQVKRTAGLTPGNSGLVNVALTDSADDAALAQGATITITFDLGPVHISIVWPIDSIDPDLLGDIIDPDA